MASACIKHLPGLVGFEALRVLEFKDCESLHEYDMNGIDKLFQLKYLSLRGTKLFKLPRGLVRLYGLETLDLRNTYIYIEELPTGINQLVKLQHLFTAHFDSGMTKIPYGIRNMRNLHVISGFNITKSSLCAIRELGNLTALKELHVKLDSRGSQEYKRHEEMLLSSVCKLGTSSNSTPLLFLDSWSPLPYNLQMFRMSTNYYSLRSDLLVMVLVQRREYLPKIPKWIVPALTNLAFLDINLIEATEEDLRILGEMPALLCLNLTFSTVQKERLALQGIGFPCLKEFYLIRACHCESAIYLTFEEGAMPKLEKLDLPLFFSVAEVYGFYLGLGHLPCLRDAEVILCNDVDTSSKSSSAADATIRNEASRHPNHPRLSIRDRMAGIIHNIDEEENYTDDEES